MQALYDQLQVYLNMDEEISFKEFDDFYKKVVKELGDSHESFDEGMLWKALFIVENIMSNADERAKESKGSEAKKYRKIVQRLQLWAKNLGGRLGALGYNEEDVNERFNQMFEEGTPAQKG
ncbi:hypothetical protein P4475_14320 [Halalkalibacterium halodurans]|jgi:hypothetical protein|uniref:Uncharacterized protein n=1 Tax=Halalkalibacterium halodurans TaxID=86665 RepID=A0A0M0KIP0_ALKHA|nr:hypothetical protein [Halalkalibacterium halodurans]MED3647959.1 hypothetical protein [Halalkalibacterium halodurans]MED4161885.1 hypothetical protein [Halalkalibacterium halodurans]TPE68939.1 hypothetical protein AMD02_010850 [Halalkalibacterium halodurans]